MTEILNTREIEEIALKLDLNSVTNWYLIEASDEVIGYLGEHLKLIIEGESGGNEVARTAFVKCMPRFDVHKAKYINELKFFEKEHVMLSKLFPVFGGDEGHKKWRPKTLLVKENAFVFEDLTLQGYRLPHHEAKLTLKEMCAVVKSIARFHSESLIYENKHSIWDDYGVYLKDPPKGKQWRDAGTEAVIEYLKIFSKYNAKENFNNKIDNEVPVLFDRAVKLLEPSNKYKNTINHRDLWSNNIFLKDKEGRVNALLIDFQTVVYCSPMIDLASVIYFNTVREFRNEYTDTLIDLYYKTLKEELEEFDIEINSYFQRETLNSAYEEAILFGITQAAIILPITIMGNNVRKKLFSDPKYTNEINEGSRTIQIIKAAQDEKYQERITELLDEFVERYIL